jgi:dTDP-glucose 4,6-dehydratase
MKMILVTGGCGFIGTNFIRYLFDTAEFDGIIVNLDKLTYAGNPKNLLDIEETYGGARYFFEKGDIVDTATVEHLFAKYSIDTIVHFAAESHVDRSILAPGEFVQTNIIGTYNLLEAARSVTDSGGVIRFHHVSTDEVYGSLGDSGYFTEDHRYDPRSPYSASKAASDHLVRSYFHTFGLPVTISNCSNNYGPYQFPEKLIPVMVRNILTGKKLPVYGDGKNIRDWLYVEDHADAIWSILKNGVVGQTYNVGGDNEWENITLINELCEIIAEITGKSSDDCKSLITFVSDRPGHDRRYAIDCSKIKTELGWKQSVSFREGLQQTAKWYVNNESWIDEIESGEYMEWIDKNYTQREKLK